MNEQLKNLVWELDRRIWASVTNGEATASWGRQESAKMIEEYASEQNAQLYPIKMLAWEITPETDPNALKSGSKFKAVCDGEVKSGESVNELMAEIYDETADYFYKAIDGFKKENAQLRKEWEAYHKKTLEEQWELAEETITKLRERIKFLEPLSEGNFEQANELNDQDQTIAQLRKENKEKDRMLSVYDRGNLKNLAKITRLTELLRKVKVAIVEDAIHWEPAKANELLTEIENAIKP